MKRVSIWVARVLVVLGLVQLFYRPWSEVVPAELVILYIWITSDEQVFKRLGRYAFLVELTYLFLFPALICYYFLQNDAFWVFGIGFMWFYVAIRLWRMYKEKSS